MFAPTIPTTGMARVLSGLYRVPAMHIDMRCVVTNTVPVDAFRGAGKPETLALLERAIDIAAQETGIDKVELRRRNFIPEAAFPYTTPLGYTYERTDYPALLDRALQLADFGGFGERRRASEARELRRGFGLACHLHPTGGIADERGCVMARADGTIEAVAGTQSQGQGHATAFAQIVAQTLDLPIETVRLIQGDSARVPQGGGTGGSSSTIISGNTLVRAGETMLARARELAAERLEVSPVDLAYADGVFTVAGTDRGIGLSALAAEVENAGGLLEGTATFDGSLQSWPAGVMTCEVELDPETGAVSVDRLDVVVDIGTVINPLLVEGQIHGGIAAGLGQALLEDARYEPGTGQLLAGSWLDYALPRAADLPFMRVALAGTASQSNALGIKGVGELPTNGAPAAVANAVLDALQPYGIRHLSSPLTSERVWRAIHASVGDEGR
jgi:carbon-monoxide dehydrogenase large subunit